MQGAVIVADIVQELALTYNIFWPNLVYVSDNKLPWFLLQALFISFIFNDK